MPQAEFLGGLGVIERASRLMSANPAKAGSIEAGIARLMAPNGMGTRFKAIGLRSQTLPPLPGFPIPDVPQQGHRMTDALKPIEAGNLSALPGVRHGFFTRAGGRSEGLYAGLNCGVGSKDATDRVLENRSLVARHLHAGWPDVVTLYQVHSAAALAVDGPIPRTDLPKADAVVTRTRGLAIGVLTADCTPVLFADRQAGVVGAAHAGWRGAAAGVLEAAIAEMEALGADRTRIAAAIGPTINQAAYEVGTDFEEALAQADPDSAVHFAPGGQGKAHFDLPGYVEARLRRAGLTNVERQTVCTYDNESLLFSFRRATHRGELDYGRQISAIVVT